MGTFAKIHTDRNCTRCVHHYQEWDGEHGQIYCGDFCTKKGQEFLSNLKSFPFNKLMPCFEMEFWHSEFAELFGQWKTDPKDESGIPDLTNSLAYREYLKIYNKPGVPYGSGRERVEELKRHPDYIPFDL